MACRGNCDDEEAPDVDRGGPEGLLAAAEPADYGQLDDAEAPNVDRGSPEGLLAAAEPVDYGQLQASIAAEPPPPERARDGVGESATVADEVMEADKNPQRTEFVVHVQQEPPDNQPPFQPAQLQVSIVFFLVDQSK